MRRGTARLLEQTRRQKQSRPHRLLRRQLLSRPARNPISSIPIQRNFIGRPVHRSNRWRRAIKNPHQRVMMRWLLQVMIRVKNAIRKNVSDIKKIWKRKVVVLYCNTSSLRILDMLLRATVAALWAGKVLAYLMGNYYFSKATYEKLFDWTDEHKFKTGKYSYKEAVIDELATASPSEYLTKISIQVF